jgi:TonB family protein
MRKLTLKLQKFKKVDRSFLGSYLFSIKSILMFSMSFLISLSIHVSLLYLLVSFLPISKEEKEYEVKFISLEKSSIDLSAYKGMKIKFNYEKRIREDREETYLELPDISTDDSFKIKEHERKLKPQDKKEGEDIFRKFISEQLFKMKADRVDDQYITMVRDKIGRSFYYPGLARRKRIEGDVLLEFIVKRDGALEKVAVLSSSGYKFLDIAAEKTIWKAAPFPQFPDYLSVKKLRMKLALCYRKK